LEGGKNGCRLQVAGYRLRATRTVDSDQWVVTGGRQERGARRPRTVAGYGLQAIKKIVIGYQ